MTKYEPLTQFLAQSGADRIPMTFEEIEKIVRGRLPESAIKYRAWWSNNPSNSVMTKAWLDAGYESSEVSVPSRKLVFRKAARKTGNSPSHDPKASGVTNTSPDIPAPPHAPLFGCLKGTITIKMDFDITSPADPDWDNSIQ